MVDYGISQSSVLIQKMAALKAERDHKYTIDVTDEFPDINRFNQRVIVGTYSRTYQTDMIRQILTAAVVDIGFGVQSHTEVARDYIAAKYPKRLRAYKDQIESFKQPRASVLYAKPCRILAGCYIDVKSAYWTIMSIVGYNVDYYPGKWLGQGAPNDDFPLPHHKIARSSIISQSLLTPMTYWTGKELKVSKPMNSNNVNYGLWALICDVLHAITTELITHCQCCYAYTDGFIVPQHKKELAYEIIRSYGLSASCQASGLSYVFGVGRYVVGDKKTKNLLSSTSKDLAYSNVSSYVHGSWLAVRLQAMAHGRTLT